MEITARNSAIFPLRSADAVHDPDDVKHWTVNRTVELGASREDVWQVVGGFYTVHEWHPDDRYKWYAGARSSFDPEKLS